MDNNLDKKDIFNYIDIISIKKLLINYPHLSILFEILCMHINNIIQSKYEKDLTLSSSI